MIEFKVIEKLKPNKGLTDILKDFKYKVILGKIKTILHTNRTILKKLHNFWKNFNFRLYLLLICEETYREIY